VEPMIENDNLWRANFGRSIWLSKSPAAPGRNGLLIFVSDVIVLKTSRHGSR
jgi:hypothetical protein